MPRAGLIHSWQGLISTNLISSLLRADPVLRDERQGCWLRPLEEKAMSGHQSPGWPQLHILPESFPLFLPPSSLQIWGRSLGPTLSKMAFAGPTLLRWAGSPTLGSA